MVYFVNYNPTSSEYLLSLSISESFSSLVKSRSRLRRLRLTCVLEIPSIYSASSSKYALRSILCQIIRWCGSILKWMLWDITLFLVPMGMKVISAYLSSQLPVSSSLWCTSYCILSWILCHNGFGMGLAFFSSKSKISGFSIHNFNFVKTSNDFSPF